MVVDHPHQEVRQEVLQEVPPGVRLLLGSNTTMDHEEARLVARQEALTVHPAIPGRYYQMGKAGVAPRSHQRFGSNTADCPSLDTTVRPGQLAVEPHGADTCFVSRSEADLVGHQRLLRPVSEEEAESHSLRM